MSTLKTATSALTAAVLVTGIGLAWAQTEDQTQPTDPMAAATASPTSEQTPADPNAIQPVDNSLQQQQPVDDPARATPPADTTAPLPSDSTAATTANTTAATPTPDNSYMAPAATTAPQSSYEPAPRADRN
jgi:hypothetical protein